MSLSKEMVHRLLLAKSMIAWEQDPVEFEF
jgi:hypothetical protein